MYRKHDSMAQCIVFKAEEMSNMFSLKQFVYFYIFFSLEKSLHVLHTRKLLCNFLLDLLSDFFLPSVRIFFDVCAFFSLALSFFILSHVCFMKSKRKKEIGQVKKTCVVWTRVAFFRNKSWKWAAWSRRALFVLKQLKYNQQ